MKGYCCRCGKDLECEIVYGNEIYPHRPDLYKKEFVRCPVCKSYTGKIIGEYPVLPTPYIRRCRREAHRALEGIWHNGKLRGKFYKHMSDIYGRNFHWGMVRSDSEAEQALRDTLNFIDSLKETR